MDIRQLTARLDEIEQNGKIEPTLDAPADAAADVADREDPPMFRDEKTDAAVPDELDAMKKNAGLSTVNIKDMLAQIIALTPEEQKQVLEYLKK